MSGLMPAKSSAVKGLHSRHGRAHQAYNCTIMPPFSHGPILGSDWAPDGLPQPGGGILSNKSPGTYICISSLNWSRYMLPYLTYLIIIKYQHHRNDDKCRWLPHIHQIPGHEKLSTVPESHLLCMYASLHPGISGWGETTDVGGPISEVKWTIVFCLFKEISRWNFNGTLFRHFIFKAFSVSTQHSIQCLYLFVDDFYTMKSYFEKLSSFPHSAWHRTFALGPNVRVLTTKLLQS